MPCFDASICMKKMTKIIFRFLISLLVCFFYSAAKADYFNLAKYTWTNRLVILVTDEKDTELERQVREFFANNVCDINDRKLKFFYFNHDKMTMAQLPKKIRARRGIWLIGYDGLIKDFSEDGQILKRLFQTIDKMPMRQVEMTHGSACY